MTAEQFAKALWFTESDGRLHDWGDHDRAMGPYQEHPDWVWDWAHKLSISPTLGETWPKFEGRLVRAFFNWNQDEGTPVHIAMHFHIGHKVVEGEKDWDAPYAERFKKYAGGG